MRVALVTGASRGIGRAIAISLAAKDISVAVHYDKSEAAAGEVVSEIIKRGGRAASFQANLTNSQAPTKLVKDVEGQLGPVDILINNAAVMTDS